MNEKRRIVLLISISLVLLVAIVLIISPYAQPQEIADYIYSPGQTVYKGGIWRSTSELVYTGMEVNNSLHFEYAKRYQCVLPFSPGNYTIGKHHFELVYINPQDASITIRIVRTVG